MTEERRADRHEVTLQGRYRTGSGMARDVVVTDLSTTGCKFDDPVHNLRNGSIISIRIGNIGPMTAQVKWLEHWTAGVRFDETLHASVLDHMLITIDGWTAPPRRAEPQPVQHKPPEPAAAAAQRGDSRWNLRVRPATVADAQAALARAGLALPLASEAELVELFHRMLEIVAVLEPGSEKPQG
jgi:hypothetical protein